MIKFQVGDVVRIVVTAESSAYDKRFDGQQGVVTGYLKTMSGYTLHGHILVTLLEERRRTWFYDYNLERAA